MTCKDCAHWIICEPNHESYGGKNYKSKAEEHCERFMSVNTMDAKEYMIKRRKICDKFFKDGDVKFCERCPIYNCNCGSYYENSQTLEKAIEIVKNYKLEDENNV